MPLVHRVISPRPPPDHRTFHHLPSPGGSDVFDLARGREQAHLHYFIRLIMLPLLMLVATISFILRQVAHFCDLHHFQSQIFVCFSLAFLMRLSVPRIHLRELLTLVSAFIQEAVDSIRNSVECILDHVPCLKRPHVVRAMCQYLDDLLALS